MLWVKNNIGQQPTEGHAEANKILRNFQFLPQFFKLINTNVHGVFRAGGPWSQVMIYWVSPASVAGIFRGAAPLVKQQTKIQNFKN